MKKKILTVVCLLFAAALVFSGCSGYSNQPIKSPQTDFDYVVYSNGGSAVQYGEYVYFINGTRGYADEDAKQNTWGSVVKGGIYRAKLNAESGKRIDGDKNIASVQSELEGSEQLFDFEFEQVKKFGDRPELEEFEKEELDEKIDRVNSVAIAPKTIGTSGYAQGGIFIYDEYVYFATPNNNKNREGVVQSGYTEFWRMRLDGKDVKKILTTKGNASAEPYGFYKWENSVYLVCSYRNADGKLDIVSVKIQGKKIDTPVYLTQEATAAYIPVRDTYDAKNPPVIAPEDFVFFVRDVKAGDQQKQGNLIEVMSPDGEEGFSFQMTGNEKPTQIEDVRDGLLFYTAQTSSDTTEVRFTNLHDMLMGDGDVNAGSKRYRDCETARTDEKRTQISGTVFAHTNFGSYTTRYYFRQHANDSHAYMLGFAPGGVFRLSAVGADSLGVKVLSLSPEKMLFVKGDYLYYLQSSTIYRTDITKSAEEKLAKDGAENEQLTDRDVVSATFTADVVADHLVFFATYDEWTEPGTAYTYFKKLRAGSVSYFIGTLAEEDIPTDDELKVHLGITEAGETEEE